MYVNVLTFGVKGVETVTVSVEVSISDHGLPCFDIVGMVDKSIYESKHRIKAAFLNSHITFPNKKIIVNLAPADLLKEGTHFDLPIAVGIYCAANNIKVTQPLLFFGELSLEGSLRYSSGAFLAGVHASDVGITSLVVPAACVKQVLTSKSINVYSFNNFLEVVGFIKAPATFVSHLTSTDLNLVCDSTALATEPYNDTIVGHEVGKRCVAISVCGGHHLLLNGSPGSGKTLLANYARHLQMPLSFSQALEIMKIYAVCGKLEATSSFMLYPPFRSPHHTITVSGMVGGGSPPKPGEISLAHNGILFLDELSEFSHEVLESLREPLETGFINITRHKHTVRFPAKFQLIATTNPCPCGFYGSSTKKCVCTQRQINQYRTKISGALLDRFDIQLNVNPVTGKHLVTGLYQSKTNANSVSDGTALIKARMLQRNRMTSLGKPAYCQNTDLVGDDLKKVCNLNSQSQTLLSNTCEKYHISSRGLHKILRVARTIADLYDSEHISYEHLSEAISYRVRYQPM